MDVGLSFFPTDETVDPPELGRMCEERGFESLFLTEHSHIPVGERTPWPGGADLPRMYFRIHDPFVALASIASATERLLLGTGICLIAERDPIITAKEVASLDVISGGRAIFGVGAGWLLEETANHGVDPARRFGVMRERVEAVRALWTEEEAEYHGDHVDFGPVYSWPKPVQDPHPPILVGGEGRGVLERVLRYGDGWMPNNIAGEARTFERIAELRRLAKERGRPRPSVTLVGMQELTPEAFERAAGAGVDRCTVWLPSAEAAKVERVMDRIAAAAAAHLRA